MQRLSSPTETVLTNMIPSYRIVPSFKDSLTKPSRRRPGVVYFCAPPLHHFFHSLQQRPPLSPRAQREIFAEGNHKSESAFEGNNDDDFDFERKMTTPNNAKVMEAAAEGKGAVMDHSRKIKARRRKAKGRVAAATRMLATTLSTTRHAIAVAFVAVSHLNIL